MSFCILYSEYINFTQVANANPSPMNNAGRRKRKAPEDDEVVPLIMFDNGKKDRVKRQIPNEQQNQNNPAASNQLTSNQQTPNSGGAVQVGSVGTGNNPTENLNPLSNNNGANVPNNDNSGANSIKQDNSNPGTNQNSANTGKDVNNGNGASNGIGRFILVFNTSKFHLYTSIF